MDGDNIKDENDKDDYPFAEIVKDFDEYGVSKYMTHVPSRNQKATQSTNKI